MEERIPDNWYRRGDPYTFMNANEYILDLFLNAPVELGGNHGLNNFAPLDLSVPNLPQGTSF